MATHTAISEKAMKRAMSQYKLEELNEITARQLAQQMNAELRCWGTVQPGRRRPQRERQVHRRAQRRRDRGRRTPPAPTRRTLAQADLRRASSARCRASARRRSATTTSRASSSTRRSRPANQALEVVPRSTSALYGKATALLNMERYQEALDTYRTLLRDRPGAPGRAPRRRPRGQPAGAVRRGDGLLQPLHGGQPG